MEIPDEKAAAIKELEVKLRALIEERQEFQLKADNETDPKERALYWTKMAMLDDAIHKLKKDLFFKRNALN